MLPKTFFLHMNRVEEGLFVFPISVNLSCFPGLKLYFSFMFYLFGHLKRNVGWINVSAWLLWKVLRERMMRGCFSGLALAMGSGRSRVVVGKRSAGNAGPTQSWQPFMELWREYHLTDLSPWARKSWPLYSHSTQPWSPDLGRKNTRCTIKFELQVNTNALKIWICPQYCMRHTYTKKKTNK